MAEYQINQKVVVKRKLDGHSCMGLIMEEGEIGVICGIKDDFLIVASGSTGNKYLYRTDEIAPYNEADYSCQNVQLCKDVINAARLLVFADYNSAYYHDDLKILTDALIKYDANR